MCARFELTGQWTGQYQHDAVQVGWSGIANTGPIATTLFILDGLLRTLPAEVRATQCVALRPGDQVRSYHSVTTRSLRAAPCGDAAFGGRPRDSR